MIRPQWCLFFILWIEPYPEEITILRYFAAGLVFLRQDCGMIFFGRNNWEMKSHPNVFFSLCKS